MLFRFRLCALCDFFEKRKRSRRQQGSKVLRCAVVVSQCTAHVCLGVFVVIIVVHSADDLIHDIGFKYFHIRKVCHMVDAVLFLMLFDFIT